MMDAGEVMDDGKAMDGSKGGRGQTNAPNSEAPIFLAKGYLQMVQRGQRASGISSWQNWCFRVYRKPARCTDVVTSPRTAARTASFT